MRHPLALVANAGRWFAHRILAVMDLRRAQIDARMPEVGDELS